MPALLLIYLQACAAGCPRALQGAGIGWGQTTDEWAAHACMCRRPGRMGS